MPKASGSPKERPYHCRLCNAAVAEDELGFVCVHVAHGAWLTLGAERPTKAEPMPDTPCTACAAAMEARKKNAEENADIHVLCRACYRAARARNIESFTPEDQERGYVLVTRQHYDRIVKREINLDVGKLEVGRALKLGFATIPCTLPVGLERMWVRVSCVLKGGVVHGTLANDPELFKRRVLKANDTVVFKAAHVLETELPKPKRSKEPKAKPKAKAKAKA